MKYPKGIIKKSNDNSEIVEVNINNAIFIPNKECKHLSIYGPIFYSEDNAILLTKRLDGDFQNLSFYLNNKYDWQIIKDSMGELCLVPTKKEKLND